MTGLSVVVASFRPSALAAQTIAALRTQSARAGAELIIARTSGGGSDALPADVLQGCRVVAAPPGATLPMVRGAGLGAATGDRVLLTEDNCRPHPDWVARLDAGFATGADVVGGTMGNAHPERSVDVAAYLSEYGFFGPARPAPPVGPPLQLTGANVGYRGEARTAAATLASAGAWEGEIHEHLARGGSRFALVREAVVDQNLHYAFGEFCRDRFAHGRTYASVRRQSWGRFHRCAAAIGSIALPGLLTARAWRHAGRLDAGAFWRAFPCTIAFFTAWSAGEATGYLNGARR
jgi:hypothetical protein